MTRPARWMAALWALGGLAGAAAQADWLRQHGWGEAWWRLPLGALAGALAVWLLVRWVAPAVGRAARTARRWAWELSGLSSPGGRRVWAAGLAVLALTAAHFAYHDWWVPRRGMEAMVAYFVQHQDRRARGLETLFYDSLDQADPPRSLGAARRWYFPDTPYFPGGRKDHFVLRWLGVLQADKPGVYGFGGYADDGLIFYVDGRPAAQDYREWGKRLIWGTVRLDAGPHAIEVSYRQVWEGAFLELLWQPPGEKRRRLDPGVLRPLKPTASLAEITRIKMEYGLAPRRFSTFDPFMGGRFWRLPW